MFKSLVIATLFVGSIASAKVDVQVGAGKPDVVSDDSSVYAYQCKQSVRQYLNDADTNVKFVKVVDKNGPSTTVYAVWEVQSCTGNICFGQKESGYFTCAYGDYN